MITYTGDIKYGTYTSAPLGWRLCDGTNGTPDHRSKVPMGTTTAGQVGNTGGATSVQLVAGNLPQHNHPFTGDTHNHPFTGSTHNHPFTGGSHNHPGTTLGTTSSGNVTTGTQGTTGWRAFSSTSTVGNANTAGTVGNATTGGTVGNATTAGTVGNAGSSNPTAVSVLQPYVVCLAIMKI